MLTALRKKKINDLANSISITFYKGSITDLELTANDEEIFYYFDHYEDSFDGMLVYDDRSFHIHINEDKGNTRGSKRGRFSFAHELGHYFLDEHRLNLKHGINEAHCSVYEPQQNEVFELEADYFASCLLMPDFRFRKRTNQRYFSLDTISDLSEKFQASVLATVLRFAEIGTHSIMAVLSQNNIVKWYSQSHDFPKWAFKFKVGHKVPETTVAGEFFTKPNSKYSSVEDIYPDDWFYPTWTVKTQLHEQCYYSNSYGYVISLIWFD